MTDRFHELALQECVEKLFRQRYFDITTFDEIVKLSGRIPNHTIRTQLRAFHCKDFSEMSAELKGLIQPKVVECLRGDCNFSPLAVYQAITAEGSNFTPIEDPVGIPDKKKKSTFRLPFLNN